MDDGLLDEELLDEKLLEEKRLDAHADEEGPVNADRLLDGQHTSEDGTDGQVVNVPGNGMVVLKLVISFF